ncbi:TonB-dependent receptor domain-containing protein [Pseudopontixanthobacter vadosimaris]|uniref:TonB-dependent receptor domain-containing protein n=1 Tax=Pseudopontixanthobacter vadosimaris TaxID=2726450 RepID=UPI0030B8CB9D
MPLFALRGRPLGLSLVALLLTTSAPVMAQVTEVPVEPADQAGASNEIVVTASRIRGSLDVDQPPVAEFDEADIAAYGAGSIDELLEAISPQTGSGRGRGDGGRPIILVNGQRISSFRELRSYPPEAIRKVEVFPEEVALRYGFAPDRRVVNIILKDNFQSREVEVEYGRPTTGGYSASEVELTYLRIDGPDRLNVNLELGDTSLLTEAERGILQNAGSVSSVAGDPDPARFRSLVSDDANIELGATWTRGLGENEGSIAVNGNFERIDGLALSGLETVLLTDNAGISALRVLDANPLLRDTRSTTIALGTTLNKPVGDFGLTATANASHGEARSLIDRRRDLSALQDLVDGGELTAGGPLPIIADAGTDRAETDTDNASALVTLRGNPLLLPGGELALTVDAGVDYQAIESSDSRTVGGRADLSRTDLSAGVNVGVPISSRREDFLSAIGDLTLNLNAGINHLSDFGTLYDYTAGLNWDPSESLSLQASYIVREAAPGLTSLGSPTIVTFNVPTFDFASGETVLASITTGGNPLLLAETQRDLKLSANYDVDFLQRSNIVVEYFRNRSDDVTANFPLLTPAIEAAFPGRVTRGASGTLVAIDSRPITFAEQRSDRLRYGVNVFGRIGKEPEREEGTQGGRGGRGAGGGPGMMFGRGADRQGRFNIAAYHTIQFSNEVLIAEGGPLLDLLEGDAISGGGELRHAFEIEGGGFYRGLGARASLNYASATQVNGSGLPGSTDLFFGDLATFDLRLFMNVEEQEWLVGSDPGIFKGVRLSLRVDNLFDARQSIVDSTDTVPLRYQPFLVDPIGRFIEIEARKIF